MASAKRNLQNIIVNKHFSKWDNDDVCAWLTSFGITDVAQFVTYSITGKFLLKNVFDDFELDNLGFRNSLERKLFLHNLEEMQLTAKAQINHMEFSDYKASKESNTPHSVPKTITSAKPAKTIIHSPNESEAATENADDSFDIEEDFYSNEYSKKMSKAATKSHSRVAFSPVVPSSPIDTSCSSSTSSTPGPLQLTVKIVEEELKWYWVSGSGLDSFFYMLVYKENGDKYKSGAEVKRCGCREGVDYVVNEFEWFELAVQKLGSTKYYLNPNAVHY